MPFLHSDIKAYWHLDCSTQCPKSLRSPLALLCVYLKSHSSVYIEEYGHNVLTFDLLPLKILLLTMHLSPHTLNNLVLVPFKKV